MEFTDSEVVLGKMGSPDSPNVSDGISIPFVTIATLTHAQTQSLPQQACVATSFSRPMPTFSLSPFLSYSLHSPDHMGQEILPGGADLL